MEVGLILGLLKVAIETFRDERKDRFLKRHVELEKEWQDEMSLPDDKRSDLALDRILFECQVLGKLIVSESSRK